MVGFKWPAYKKAPVFRGLGVIYGGEAGVRTLGGR